MSEVAGNAYDGWPVVIGSSLSGLLVSDALSRAGVRHVLLGGGPPNDRPRLGESMNECAGPELWRLYHQELGHAFYPKHHISLLHGEMASMVHLGNPRSSPERAARSVLDGGRVRFPLLRNVLLHVDRLAFDAGLYRLVRSREACVFLERKVVAVEADRTSDRVTGIRLDDGTRIDRPRYVFDATGGRCLVGEALGVARRDLSGTQRVAWAHLGASDEQALPGAWWTRGTNLLRMVAAWDEGIDGIGWLIPLGRTVSLGVSVDAERYADVEGDELVERFRRAYARRGIDVRAHWPETSGAESMEHRYTIRERAWGGNWLLVGGSFVQVWFPSSAGVWTSTAAAGLAAELIEQPEPLGAFYQRAIVELLDFHEHLAAMIQGPPMRTHREVYAFWSRWLAMLPRRIAGYLQIANHQTARRHWSHRMMHAASWLMVRQPRLQLTYWGLPVTRSVRQPELARQAEAFDGYFDVLRFRGMNYLRGLPHLLGPLGGPKPASEELAASTAG